jgi:serine/threonine protein kinase
MAPEVLKGNQYSSKADMWAIGLTFLEMLIGNLPWEAVK